MPRFLDEVVRGKAKPFALAAVAGGRVTGIAAPTARIVWRCSPRSSSRSANAATILAEGARGGRRWAGRWVGTACCWRPKTYPHLFSAVVATAPAVWPSYQAMMLGPGDVFDSAADFAAHDVIGQAALLGGTPLLVECGTTDPFYPYVRDLCARLPAGSHYRFSPGGHANDYWRSLEPAPLQFVARHLGVLLRLRRLPRRPRGRRGPHPRRGQAAPDDDSLHAPSSAQSAGLQADASTSRPALSIRPVRTGRRTDPGADPRSGSGRGCDPAEPSAPT